MRITRIDARQNQKGSTMRPLQSLIMLGSSLGINCLLACGILGAADGYDPKAMAAALRELEIHVPAEFVNNPIYLPDRADGKPRPSGCLGYLGALSHLRFRVESDRLSKELSSIPITFTAPNGQPLGDTLSSILDKAGCEFAVLSNGDVLVKKKHAREPQER